MNAKKSTKKIISMLSLLLAAFLFLGSQDFTIFTETISENGAAATGSREQENAEADGTYPEDSGNANPTYPENSHSANPQQEVLPDSNVSENNACVGAGTPANPIHYCTKKDDGTDYTDFSHVYFGTYPQSEVTDSSTIAAIDNAIATAGTTADAGMDVWVKGTRYRRISKNDTNYSGNFDDMPASNGYRYFKWERIKWKVLNNDGSTLFVVADKAIDCKDYNDEYVSTTWETSTIRDWLNDSFYGTAFSSSEQNAIITQDVVNEDNPYYGTEGGNNTSDKIYLLSIGEVTNETYGFCSDYSTYSMSRRMKASDYANARGTWRNSSSAYEGNCWWWLRSIGHYSSSAAYVLDTGYVWRDGNFVGNYADGICPALHINLSSDIWSMADDGTSGEGGNGSKVVVCTLSEGKIVKMEKAENIIEPQIYIVNSGNDIVYQNGEFSDNAMDIQAGIICGVKKTYNIPDLNALADLGLAIDKLEVTVPEGILNFGESGLIDKKKITEKEEKINRTINLDDQKQKAEEKSAKRNHIQADKSKERTAKSV